MLRELLAWWIRQLADLVPEHWRQVGSVSDAVLIAPRGPTTATNEVTVDLRRQGRETPLGIFELRAGQVLELPPACTRLPSIIRLAHVNVLSKTLRLPLAADRQLDQVLTFEMDRETPFGADDVYWSCRILKRDRERKQLLVRLVLMPRAGLTHLLNHLAAAGIVPQRAEIADGPDAGCFLPLAATGAQHRTASYVWLRWQAAALCGGLAVAAAALPFVQQSAALGAVDREIAAGRATAVEAEELRQEISRLSDTVDLVESERDKAGHPLAVLATLTRLIPDDTYLTELQQQLHKITLSGRSTAAARLLAALAASDQVQNPAFTAPVTRLEATQSEIFTIALEVGL